MYKRQEQINENATAIVEQSGDSNDSNIFQGNPLNPQADMTTDVLQSGERNDSVVNQASRLSVIDIDQIGNDNVSTVTQSFGTRGSTASVTQSGDDNLSDIVQRSDGPGAPPFSFETSATVDQRGLSDESFITQESTAATAFVTQIGTLAGNLSTINQDGPIDDVLLGLSLIHI